MSISDTIAPSGLETLKAMPQATPTKHPGQVLAVLFLAAFSFALAQTLVIPALPELARDTHASPAAASRYRPSPSCAGPRCTAWRPCAATAG